MSRINPENLLAVALIINRSRDGPAFVFHYPPDVPPIQQRVSEAEHAGEFEDILLERLALADTTRGGKLPSSQSSSSIRHHHEDHHHNRSESGSQAAAWEKVAGFPTRDLASILTPARAYHKKLFELSLDPLHCIAYPIHVPTDGKWKKTKKTKSERAKSTTNTVASEDLLGSVAELDTLSPQAAEREKEKDGKKEDDEEKRSSMTMFTMVFFLHPNKSQTRELVDSLYSNVVKKVNKAYQYSQQHSDFVWKESKRILAAKDRAREERRKINDVWKELISASSLAASVQDVYKAISQNKIATLHLETAAGALNPSVQIPVPFYVSDLAPVGDVRFKGLWLTTANAFISQDALEEPGFLDKNFALLLMDDEKKIIAELQADQDPATMAMVEFVRLAQPTVSFYQVAQSGGLSLSQVRRFAQHFIFWRRAIAIPPLHARDTYIVSPNCNLFNLTQEAAEWQREFPVAPPLPNFLAELSACPRPFKTFCPSKAHRQLYLRMLAWLLRGGWVTQLCTFGYVVVWPEILYEVEYEMEAEELLPAPSTGSSPPSAGVKDSANKSFYFDDDNDNDESHPKSPSTPPPSANISPEDSAILSPSSASPELLSTSFKAGQPSAIEKAAEAARLSRLAARHEQALADKVTAHARKTVPITTPHPSTNTAPHLSHLAPHVILDAKKATGRESRYLSAIGRRLADRDERVGRMWPRLCKYLDGHTALERVALMEEMKRKEAWGLLSGMAEYVAVVRHW